MQLPRRQIVEAQAKAALDAPPNTISEDLLKEDKVVSSGFGGLQRG